MGILVEFVVSFCLTTSFRINLWARLCSLPFFDSEFAFSDWRSGMDLVVLRPWEGELSAFGLFILVS